MSIGTGIFLSSFLFAIVLLYIKRRGTWGIRKVLRVLFGIFTSIALASTLGYWYYTSPNQITELKGVKLGETLRDLEFKYGELEKMENSDARIIDHLSIGVFFNQNGRVNEIAYACNTTGKYTDWTSLDDIRCGDDSEKIMKKYGRLAKLGCYPDENDKRIFIVKKYLRVYRLKHDQVISFRIYATRSDMPKITENCD